MWVITLQRDLVHAYCNINYEYIYMRLLFEDGLLFLLTHDPCGDYSRVANISANSRSLRRLFEGGYYSKCSVYSRKSGILERCRASSELSRTVHRTEAVRGIVHLCNCQLPT